MKKGKRGNADFRIKGLAVLVLFSSTFLATAATADSLYTVTVDSSAISGMSAQLAFDFIAGGSSANSVTVSGFSTDGILGASFPTGGVSGTLPGTVALTDSSFFNEYLTDITLGTNISFLLSTTSNAPASGFFPDAFSLSVLDPFTGLPLFATSDPTGANTLTVLSLDGSAKGSLSTYTAPGGEAGVTATAITTQVPEPVTLLLMSSGLAFLLWRRSART
jgi:hypothetical protein